MYFSGHLTDSYSLCIESLNTDKISDIISDFDNDARKYTDKQQVKLCGIVSSVSRKTTKNGANMAFFKLEDRFGELECVVFSKQYERFSHLLTLDTALFVEGNLSYKDDEPPRVLLASAAPLVENSRFSVKATAEEKKEEPKPTPEVTPAAQSSESKQRKLYLKVPSLDSEEHKKCENLIAIFPGNTPVVYFESSTKKYFSRIGGIALSEYLMSVLKKYVGDQNAIFK
jgi:DNA polymerase-3 subunit alpha